jgi:uncharacterized cupin superfamily protein
MPNIHDPDYDEVRDHPGFACRRARLGRQVGAHRLGVSLWEVPPGQAAYPYHFHLAEEELLVVLDGRPSMREPTGWRELAEGDVIAYPSGEEGAHQLANRTDAPVRFLAISTAGEPDVVVQPDSGKVGAFERRPEGGGMRLWFRDGDAVDYWEGETGPNVGP